MDVGQNESEKTTNEKERFRLKAFYSHDTYSTIERTLTIISKQFIIQFGQMINDDFNNNTKTN